MAQLIQRFLADRQGATAVEYSLIVALIALAVIGAVTTLGGAVKGRFESAATLIGS